MTKAYTYGANFGKRGEVEASTLALNHADLIAERRVKTKTELQTVLKLPRTPEVKADIKRLNATLRALNEGYRGTWEKKLYTRKG